MLPPPALSSMCGTSRRVRRKADVTLKRNASSNMRSLVCSASIGGVPPALLTRMSTRPNSRIVAATSASRCGALHDVAHQPAAPCTPERARLLGGRLDLLARARRAHHVRPLLGEGQRARPRRCRARRR